jgi:hypothetical protein
MTDPATAVDHITKDSEKPLPVFVVLVDRFTAVATRGYVVHRAGKLDS